MFSPWYSWQIAELALQQSHTHSLTQNQDACVQVDLEDNMITDKIDSIEGILTKLGIIINKYVDDEDDDIDNIYDFVQYIC